MNGAEATYFQSVLRDELTNRCSKNPRYSLRSFARALNVDAATLSRILADKKIPSKKTIQKFVQTLSLNPDQEQKFIQSIELRKQKQKIKHLRHSLQKIPLIQKKGVDAFLPVMAKDPIQLQELDNKIFQTISDWYHYAILELSYLKDFSVEPRWISKKLGISVIEAKLAIERLLNTELLRIKKNGKAEKTNNWITVADKEKGSAATLKRHKQIFSKAMDSLENDPVEDRTSSSITMAIDPRRIPKAKEMIKNFNRKLCAFLEEGDRSEVYELAVVLFPLQKKDTNDQEQIK